MNFYQRMGTLPLKKRVNRDKCSFATKQRMFGVFAIDEILRYRGSRIPGSPTLCHPGLDIKPTFVQTFSTWFGQEFETEVQARFWSWTGVSGNDFWGFGNGKGMKKSIPMIRERESEAFILGNGREREFPLTPDWLIYDRTGSVEVGTGWYMMILGQ